MKKNAFTLLELLVVIGIIGILVALATVSYTATQAAARDSRRKQDMVAMQNALEQYYSSHTFAYPVDNCSLAQNNMTSAWPTDPENTAPYVYAESCTGTKYCICATMERNTGGNSDSACNFSNATKSYYCVANLQ